MAGDPQAFSVRVSAGTKAVALLSGGLDSTLTISLMLEQGIDVLAINFVGPFCTCSPRREGGCHLASKAAREMGVQIRVISKGIDYLRVIERPRFGRGRGLNACIDCRIFMLRYAAVVMNEIGASFVVTGEVLGQRPMSQHRVALGLIERESGIAGRLLRPLSAHLLDATIPEREGIVQRDLLLGIRGRGRGEQLKRTHERNITVFGCPAGGCLLTDPVIARRMLDVFERCPRWELRDAQLATLGRHLRIHDSLKVIIGRNEAENERLSALAGPLPVAELAHEPGPVAIVRGTCCDSDLQAIGRLLRFYAKKAQSSELEVHLKDGDRLLSWIARERANAEEVERWTI